MNIITAIILGIVEGFTEFLPISSTAHLILTSKLLGLTQSTYVKSFEIIIQSGAIAAVIVLYWREFLKVEVFKRLVVGFIPTGVIGFLFYKIVKQYFIGNVHVLLWSLALGGIFLIVFEYFHKEKNIEHMVATMSYRHCLAIGLFQSIAIIPGVSRSAATIIGGMALGLSRKTVVEFSFLLAVPTLLAATGLDLVKSASSFSSDQFYFLAVGFLASFVTAFMSIKFFLSYIRKNTFTAFGVYRVIVVILFLVLQY